MEKNIVILLCICSSFIICDKNGLQTKGIPLRDYDDINNKYYDGSDEEYFQQFPNQSFETTSELQMKKPSKAESATLFALLKPEELPQLPTIGISTTVKITTLEMCPKECSCLNDFMICTRSHLKFKQLPDVPHFIKSLYVVIWSCFFN